MARTLEDELLLLLSSSKVSQNAEPGRLSFETKKSFSTKLKESLKLFSRGRSRNKVPAPVQQLFKSKDNKDEDEQLGFCLDPPRFSCDGIGESKYLCKEPPRRSLDSQLLLKEEETCYEPARRSLDVRMLCKTYFSSENGRDRGSGASAKVNQKQGTNVVARLMGLEDLPTAAANRRNKLRDLLNTPDADVSNKTEVASKTSWTTRNSDFCVVERGPQEQQRGRTPSSVLETRKVGDQKRQETLKQVKAVDDDKKLCFVSEDLPKQARKVENRHSNSLAQVKVQQQQQRKKTTEDTKSKVTTEPVGRKPWQLSGKIAAQNRTAVVQKSSKKSTDNRDDKLKEIKTKSVWRPSKEVARLRDHLRTSSCRVGPEEVSRSPNKQSKSQSSTQQSSSRSQQKSTCNGIGETARARASNSKKARGPSMVSSIDEKLPTSKDLPKSSSKRVQVPNKPEKQHQVHSRTGNSSVMRPTSGWKPPPQQPHVRDVVRESKAASLGLRKISSATTGKCKEEETSTLRRDVARKAVQSSTSLKDPDDKKKEGQYKQEEMEAQSCKANSDNALSPVSVLDAFNKEFEEGGERNKRLVMPRTPVKVPKSSGEHFTFADIVEQEQEICSDHWMLTDCKVCSREIGQRLENTIFDNLVYETIIYFSMHLK